MRSTPRDLGWSLGGQRVGCRWWFGGRVGLIGDDPDPALGEYVEAHVAASFGPLVGLFGQDRADQADQ